MFSLMKIKDNWEYRMIKERNIKQSNSITAALIRFSLPLILSGIMQQLYSWADAFIVGNVEGEIAIAAIGSTTTVINFLVLAITGFALGLNILFAQKYGAGDCEYLPRLLSSFAIVSGVVFTALSILGYCFSSQLLGLMNTTPETINLAGDYIRIVFAGVPFLAVYNAYSAALRGIGDAKAPFYAVLISAILNVVLDVLFVAVLHCGVQGAAFATAASQIVMTAFIVIYTIRRHSIFRFSMRKKLFDFSVMYDGIRFGIPPMIQSSITAVGALLLQNFMNGFGTQTVAAITSAYRVDSIILLPIINLGSGISTVVAQNYGAGNLKRAKKALRVGVVLMTAVSAVISIIVIPTGGYLISIFGVSKPVVNIGRSFFAGIACFYVVYGLAMAVRGYIEGVGDIMYSSIAGILSLFVRIAASYAFADVCGNMIIAYAEGLSWCFMLVLYAARLIWLRYKPVKS